MKFMTIFGKRRVRKQYSVKAHIENFDYARNALDKQYRKKYGGTK